MSYLSDLIREDFPDLPKMDPEIKAKWLDELRSGQWLQARGKLRTADDKYCCLGVLCQIVDPTGWTLGTVNSMNGECHAFQGETSLPPEELLENIRLDYSFASDLASKNDCGKTFIEIANMIEEFL